MEKKKNDQYDLNRKNPLFFSIGLIIAMLCVTVAFEWRSEYDKLEIDTPNDIFEPPIDIPITSFPKPKPPKPKKEKVEVVKPEQIKDIVEADENEIQQVLDVDPDDFEVVIDIPDVGTDENPDEPFIRVESMPEFPGGEKAFYKYIAENLEYPSQARHMGVEGRVHVEFIINRDGDLTDIKVLKGIGAGCDEEAIRVLENAPAFIPGKQRGQPVRVRTVIPIFFKLSH